MLTLRIANLARGGGFNFSYGLPYFSSTRIICLCLFRFVFEFFVMFARLHLCPYQTFSPPNSLFSVIHTNSSENPSKKFETNQIKHNFSFYTTNNNNDNQSKQWRTTATLTTISAVCKRSSFSPTPASTRLAAPAPTRPRIL